MKDIILNHPDPAGLVDALGIAAGLLIVAIGLLYWAFLE